MENIPYDILYEISKYLSDRDLFHLLIVDKYFYQYISLYLRRKVIQYKHITKYKINTNYVYGLLVKCEFIHESNMNIFQKFYYLWKHYVAQKKKHKKNYHYTIYVHPIRLQISNLTYLNKIVFDDYFNQELNFTFPPNVKFIHFGKRFSRSIDNLPDSIEKIEFDYRSFFSQKIKHYPMNLKEIVYGRCFIHDIDNLPDSVEIIKLKSPHNHCVITKLPRNLTMLLLYGDNTVECEVGEKVKIYTYEHSYLKLKKHINGTIIKWSYKDIGIYT